MFEMLRRIQFLWLQSRFDSGYKSRTIVDKQNEIRHFTSQPTLDQKVHTTRNTNTPLDICNNSKPFKTKPIERTKALPSIPSKCMFCTISGDW